MSIFTKVTALFCLSIILMLFLSTQANKINDEKTELIHKQTYIQISKELFNYLAQGDLTTLEKTLDKLNYSKQNLTQIKKNLQSIYKQDISFGEIQIYKQKDNTYVLYMKYLDDEFYLYDESQHQELEQKEHLNYLIIADILILVVMFLVIINILKPLKVISRGLNKFGAGNYSKRLQPLTSKDEIADVINKFNVMAENLESLITSRTQFLSDISHELRTPISKAKISLEMIEESKYSNILKKAISHIDELTNELLELERLNSNTLMLNMEKHSIETILANALDKMIIENEENMNIEIKESFESVVDLNYISMAIKNLIDNALKYKTEQKVNILVEKNSLSILNIGAPLSKDLEYYMQTFTQEDNTRNIKGYGLGLNIVKRVLEHHKFILQYRYRNGQNIFTILFEKKI
ncbi:MAG: ArsS family sensor histidine kinase [Arcobacteraceae bacterium]